MMNEENTDHAELLDKIAKKYYIYQDEDHEIIDRLNLVHHTKISLLDSIYNQIKEIK